MVVILLGVVLADVVAVVDAAAVVADVVVVEPRPRPRVLPDGFL